MSREVQVRFCESRAVRSRPATHLVVMVFGSRAQTEALYGEIDTVLAPVGLHLAPDKTRVTSIDEGFDFLGFRIRRHRQKGSNRRLIYTPPADRRPACPRTSCSDTSDNSPAAGCPMVAHSRRNPAYQPRRQQDRALSVPGRPDPHTVDDPHPDGITSGTRGEPGAGNGHAGFGRPATTRPRRR